MPTPDTVAPSRVCSSNGKRSLSLALLVAVAALAACEQPTAPEPEVVPQSARAPGQAPEPQQVPDQYIVRFRENAPDAAGLTGQLERAFGLLIRHRYRGAIRGFSAAIPPAVVEALRNNPFIESIEPNYVIQLSSETSVSVPQTGLRVHVVAEDLAGVVADGAGVAAWPNRGSGADAVQASASRLPSFHAGSPSGPFGGRPYVGFNEGSDNDEVLEIPGVSPHGSGTLIAVFRQEDVTSHNYGLFAMWGSSTNRGGFGTYRSTSPNRLHYWDQTTQWVNSSFTPSAGAPYVAVWRVEGSVALDFQVNGQAQGSTPLTSNIHQPFDRYLIGASEPNTSSRFDGQVAELIFWDRPLPDCERDQVVADLGVYYGIAVAVSGGGACTVPPAPTALTATASGSNRIDLAWTDNSSNETGFAIERRQGSGSFAEVARVAPNATSYSDAGLSAVTSYCYRLRAFNGNGTSSWTTEACATTSPPPPAQVVPVPGAGLRVRVVGADLSGFVADGAGVATWQNRGSAGNAAQGTASRLPTFHAGSASGPFGGRAYVGFNEGSDNDEVMEIAGVSPHGSGTLVAVFRQEDVSSHNYGLFAMWGSSTNRGGFGTYRTASPNSLHYWDQTSQWVNSSFTVSAGTPYVAVWRVEGSVALDFQVNGVARGSASLTSNIHQPFDRYLIGASEPSTSSRFDGQVAELLFWDRPLPDCERDQIVADLGAYYAISVAVTGHPCVPPAQPSGLTATATSSVVASLSWIDGSTNENGFAIERRQGTGSFAEVARVAASVTTYADAGLVPETNYCYRVRAFNGDGSSYSLESCVTTPAPDPGQCVDTGTHDSLAELWNIAKVRADQNLYWKASQRSGCEIRAWYFGIDSGVDSDHPDLNVAQTQNFVATQPGHSGEDGNGHGTHTAGTAAARDGNGGVVGVAPGARVYGFRVCTDDGSCSYDDIIAAVDEVWARKVANPTQPMVANLSLAGPPTDAMDTAIRRAVNAGVIVLMAAGNGFLGTCLLAEDAATISPARTGDDAINAVNGSDGNTRRLNGAIAVTSSDANDRDVNCNYGNPVTVAAPGEGIKSTWLNGGYHITSGTSMATPHVAGAAMLYLQSRPNATPTEVEQAIVNRLVPWTTNEQPNASGRLDAGKP